MEVLHKRRGPVAHLQGPRKVVEPRREERPLPPRVPETLPEVDEALMLLGNLIQCLQAGGKFRDSRRAKVQLLVGSVPELATARAWKAGLKELRAELAELEARA